MIYLDNSATTLKKPQQVIDAVVNAMQSMGNVGRGAYSSALHADRTVYHARKKIADFFGCPRADYVVFTSNVTEALNTAINGILKPGDHAVTTALEHNSVLRPLYRLVDEHGLKLDMVPADEKGNVNYEDFERLITPDTKAVVVTHASNLTGTMLDIKRISDIAHAKGALLIVDVSQSAGAVPINMQEMGIDVLCFTGHKGLMGPQGTGGLCLMPGVEIAPWNVGGTGVHSYDRHQPNQYPTRLEAGTLNGHGIAGLSAAIDFLNETGVENIGKKERELMRRFYDGVSKIPGVTVYGDFTQEPRAAIVTLNIGDYDSSAVSDELSVRYGISTRPGAHCAPRMHEALGTDKQGSVRFSFGYFNTPEEVDEAIKAVREIAQDEEN